MAQRIKRFNVGQSAKFMGVLHFALGLLVTPIFLLMMMAAPDSGPRAFGMMFALAMPIIYGIFGSISGAVGSLLYNGIAAWIGGIEVEIDAA